MIALATVVERFESQLLQSHGQQLLPSQRRALSAMKRCRTSASRQMLVKCQDCEHRALIPHSCGHRLCPHCQSFESQRWLERQQKLRVPCEYFMMTFTVPRELRVLAYAHQRLFYDALMKGAWQTIRTFTANDKELKGVAGAIAVLHTHNRRLDYHPHVHLIVPAGAINAKDKCWRSRVKRGFLFSHKALGKVFRAKLLSQLASDKLTVPTHTAKTWNVGCQSVGRGDKAIVYLGRYLYKGVVREKDILGVQGKEITYRYKENSGCVRTRTISGVEFLWRLLRHALPKGFRRSRNYGFLHHNSKRLIQAVQLLLLKTGLIGPKPESERPGIICTVCGGLMQVVALGLSGDIKATDTEPSVKARATVM